MKPIPLKHVNITKGIILPADLNNFGVIFQKQTISEVLPLGYRRSRKCSFSGIDGPGGDPSQV
jgi:hypothetical protein